MPCARSARSSRYSDTSLSVAGARALLPPKMPVHQLVGLQHAGALADRDIAAIEGELQRALRRLSAGPGMLLLDQHVVVDVADGERAVAAQPRQDFSEVGLSATLPNQRMRLRRFCGASRRRKKRKSRVGT